MNITELYKTYFTQLTEKACRWVPMEDARDITQDVFLTQVSDLEFKPFEHTL